MRTPYIDGIGRVAQKRTVAYFTREINPSLAKLPLNCNGGLAKLGLTSLVK